MGALRGEYRWLVAEIRDANDGDFDAVFELLDARSRAAFGISQQDRKFLRQRWDVAGAGAWVAVSDGAVVGYASLDETQEIALAAVDPGVGDALFAHVERDARRRGFEQVDVTAVPEDE